MKNIAVLTGAGISAESGIKTFRDSDGLWENYRVEDVASYDAWIKNKELVLEFYNQRRRQVLNCEPNDGHKALVELEKKYNVTIVTQNVDDLHERAGSKNILHLHGELLKARSTKDDNLIYDWREDIKVGDKCEKGWQLRPHIVWFGEAVPMFDKAIPVFKKADIVLVVGTSLVVYPAAGLVNYANYTVTKYVVDPNRPTLYNVENVEFVVKPATTGVREIVDRLLEEA